MIWEIHLCVFDTFTKERRWGYHPGRMFHVAALGFCMVGMVQLLEIPKVVEMGECVGWFGFVGLVYIA